MSRENDAAHERVRQRIADWVKQHGHGSQRILLKNIKDWCRATRSDQWLSDILHRRANIMLDDVDLVACAMECPPGELIRQNDRNYLELTMQETTVVQWFRSMTTDARRYFLGWLEIIAYRPRDSGIKLPRPSTGGSPGHAHVDQGSASLDLPATPVLETIDADIAEHIAALGRLHHLRKSTLASLARERSDHATKRGADGRTTAHHIARHGRKKPW